MRGMPVVGAQNAQSSAFQNARFLVDFMSVFARGYIKKFPESVMIVVHRIVAGSEVEKESFRIAAVVAGVIVCFAHYFYLR